MHSLIVLNSIYKKGLKLLYRMNESRMYVCMYTYMYIFYRYNMSALSPTFDCTVRVTYIILYLLILRTQCISYYHCKDI